MDSEQCITCGRPADWKPRAREMEIYRWGRTVGRWIARRDAAPTTMRQQEVRTSALAIILQILMTMLCPVRFLRMDEQLRVQHLTTVTVVNGPAACRKSAWLARSGAGLDQPLQGL